MRAVFLTLYGGDGDLSTIGQHALGPFADVVIRSLRVVGGPTASERILAFRGSDGRWLEAAEEERRGVASDSPYARHSHLRLHSPAHDLMVRFFPEDKDDAPAKTARELGPYSAVTIGPQELRADGALLADRATAGSPWVTHEAFVARAQSTGGAVLAVRSGAIVLAGEDSRVAPTPAVVVVPKSAVTVTAGATVPAIAQVATVPTVAAVATEPPVADRSEFKFIERVRVDPKIYRARGTDSERDP